MACLCDGILGVEPHWGSSPVDIDLVLLSTRSLSHKLREVHDKIEYSHRIIQVLTISTNQRDSQNQNARSKNREIVTPNDPNGSKAGYYAMVTPTEKGRLP